MSKLNSLFPELPKFSGWWRTVYLEPIVGSGERIAIAVLACGQNEFKVTQAIRNELLDCLYGQQSENMRSMISWVIDTIRKEFKQFNSLEKWVSPFEGVTLGNQTTARGQNLDEILRQAVRFTSSLSSLSLDAERSEDEVQPRRYSEHWSRSIAQEIKSTNPQLLPSFGQKVQLGESKLLTSFGFIHGEYTANFGLLVPSRLSASLNSVKAKLLDLETFKKSGLLARPSNYEIIIGTPADADPTLTDSSLKKLRDNIDMIGELASSEGIEVFRAESSEIAAEHIAKKVA
jgi:hypothetical protein